MYKQTLLVGIFLCLSHNLSAQLKKIKSSDPFLISKGWKLVKTNAATYGIMDASGKLIVQPVYTSIQRFDVFAKNVALVKNVSDGYGFIDTTGREVVPAQFELPYIKSHFSVLRTKYMEKKSR